MAVEKKKKYNLTKIADRLSMQPWRIMEQRNREMHEQVIHIEKDKHNLDKSCPICNEEVRIRKERF